MTKIIKEVQSLVRIIFFTILKFYDVKLNARDLKKDLIINMITTFILKNNVYHLLISAITLGTIILLILHSSQRQNKETAEELEQV